MTGEDILFWKNVYVETGFEVQKTWGALAAIAVVAGTLASAFAWTAGWLGSRTVSQALVGETPKPFPPGFRRAHGKGICFAGTFTPNGSADSFNLPPLLAAGSARGGPILYWYWRSACPG
jgi:hypothetical protein